MFSIWWKGILEVLGVLHEPDCVKKLFAGKSFCTGFQDIKKFAESHTVFKGLLKVGRKLFADTSFDPFLNLDHKLGTFADTKTYRLLQTVVVESGSLHENFSGVAISRAVVSHWYKQRFFCLRVLFRKA